ncbi:MAG: RsmE family RNA methyltransferase [Rhodothermia bacterium]|nr:MAG: RsmE family RNA methyltransferase [Rhodothermia bacterium]
MKHTFFAPPEAVTDSTISFSESESHHATRVLRIESGDEVAVVDGEGNWYRVSVEVLGRKNVLGSILEHRSNVGEPGYRLTIGIGMLKNVARFETFLEKAVELGVSQVVPLVTKRSEKSRINKKRAETIITSATKQSGRSRRIALNDPVKFKKWIKQLPLNGEEFRAICHEGASEAQSLDTVGSKGMSRRSMVLLIGPEGGFSEEELEQAAEKGFVVVSLGPRRLRTETAAIVSAATIMLSNYGEGAL